MDKVHEIVASLPVDEAVVPNMPSLRHTIYFLFHGVHHEYPSDARRLVMPPVASIPMAFVVWLVFLLVFGIAARPAFAGMMVGYLIYDSTHFLVHHYSMPTKFGKFIKRHHMRHHFKDPDKDYGVSSPAMGRDFRTFSGDRKRLELRSRRSARRPDPSVLGQTGRQGRRDTDSANWSASCSTLGIDHGAPREAH